MITVDEAKKIAKMLREDGLPDPFNRWLGVVTPAAIQETTTMQTIVTNVKTDPKPGSLSAMAAQISGQEGAKKPAAPAAKKAEPAKPAPAAKAKPEKPAPAPAKAKAPAKKEPAPAPEKPAKKAKPAGERPDGLRAGSKLAIMLDMLVRPEGATEEAVCKKLGWKRCRTTIRRVVEKVGAKLTTEKPEDGSTVYKATMPKKKAAA